MYTYIIHIWFDGLPMKNCHSFHSFHGESSRDAEESIHEAYDADPELRLVLGFRVSIREAWRAWGVVYDGGVTGGKTIGLFG